MYNENPEIDTLLTEFQAVTQQLDLVLKDIEWRKPDVEREEKTLRALRKKALKDPGVDVASQAIVVRVGRAILDDKIAEANRLEKRMKEIQAQLEKAEAAKEKPEEGEEGGAETGAAEDWGAHWVPPRKGEHGEAVPEETQPVG